MMGWWCDIGGNLGKKIVWEGSGRGILEVGRMKVEGNSNTLKMMGRLSSQFSYCILLHI